MLSRLLRRLLLGQILLGAVLGWFIAGPAGSSLALLVAGASLLPLLFLVLISATSVFLSRAPGSPAPWWRLVGGEFRAMVHIFLLQQPWTTAAPTLEPANPGGDPATQGRAPVLLVHGFLCNHRVWDAMARRLRSAGHPVLRLDLEPLFQSIDSYAPRIEEAVLQLCAQTGASKVALVGHSMGGLAIRAWLRRYGTARAATVITLGTPHAGTRIARRPRSANGEQMHWNSDWLQQLAASESPASRSLMRIALTPHDNIVYPQREQVLEGAGVAVFEGLGHLELCLNSAVATWVLRQLSEPTLA
jgi:triacylglycerol lipase